MKIEFDSNPDTPDLGERFCTCVMCENEMPRDGSQSPESWARLSIAMTKQGFQVWCVRHNANVVNIIIGQMDIPECPHCEGHDHSPACRDPEEVGN